MHRSNISQHGAEPGGFYPYRLQGIYPTCAWAGPIISYIEHFDMAPDEKMKFERLMELASESAAVSHECACAIDSYREWSSIPVSFPAEQMRVVGTLAGDPYAEPTFTEFHPAGTHYWSPDAPIAMRHFPYNRCTVLQCRECGRCCLKYVEAGGYYVEPRIRALDPGLIVDEPL